MLLQMDDNSLSSDQVSLPQKITEYESFINDKLRVDLARVEQLRVNLDLQLSEMQTLKSLADHMKNHTFGKGKLKTKVDLGSGFYANCVIPNQEKIFVHLGLGFYIELDPIGTIKFAEKREKLLLEEAELLTKKSNLIKAHIKLILAALSHLQGI